MKTVHLSLAALLLSGLALAEKIRAPRVWNDKDLANWAAPVAGLNVRPGHYSEREYYEAPVAEWLRTYPVYFPGREPQNYFEELQKKRPEPLISSEARTKDEWIRAGKTVFREIDVPVTRSLDPELIAQARSVEALKRMGASADPDGTISSLRWVPTPAGLALSVVDCGGCHTRIMSDGSRIEGAPLSGGGNGLLGQLASRAIAAHYGDTPTERAGRVSAAPWIPDDVHEKFRTMEPADLRGLFRAIPQGVFVRFNGSPYYPTKVPDLIGIGERRYIDHTATHALRSPGDVMRYAALVGCCDSADFGPHRIWSDAQRRIVGRHSDEVLFALVSYIYSLRPPENPHRNDPRVRHGRVVFMREGCAGCHTPPFYTNNKLTLADGFTPPEDHPFSPDIMPASVKTDSGLAMRTRKGTGLYKVPSLKGVWYRGRYNHDGSISSLEEWFDPARLTRVQGHEFGLRLKSQDKDALLAFLRSL